MDKNETKKSQEDANLREQPDVFVDARHSLGESFAVPVHIQAQQVVVNQVQGHLTSKLRCYRRDLVGLIVGFIVKLVHGVQLSAIISVDLRLKWRNIQTVQYTSLFA